MFGQCFYCHPTRQRRPNGRRQDNPPPNGGLLPPAKAGVYRRLPPPTHTRHHVSGLTVFRCLKSLSDINESDDVTTRGAIARPSVGGLRAPRDFAAPSGRPSRASACVAGAAGGAG